MNRLGLRPPSRIIAAKRSWLLGLGLCVALAAPGCRNDPAPPEKPAAPPATPAGRAHVPEAKDDETTFDDLRARISRTRAFLDGLTPAQMADSEIATIEQPTRVGTLTFPGPDFLLHFALPQFLFHVTTAYDIIRHAGVEIGKVDFMGSAVR